MQDSRTRLGGPFADGLLVEPQLAAEAVEVGASGSRGQCMNLLEDARLHLFGGLVRKGHGEDMAVEVGPSDDVADEFVGQLVGLSRSGARIQNLRSHSSKSRFSKVKVRNKSRISQYF